jgi:hypothetical protein
MTRIGLSLVLVCAALAGCGKPVDQKQADADLGSAKPDHTATVAEWHAEFKKDSAGAKAKYKGKVVELTGTVSMLAENADAGVMFVHLKVEGDLLGVRCGFSDTAIWEKFCEKSEVTIRGKLPEMSFLTGELMPVTLVAVKSNPSKTITATDLATRFKADLPKLKEEFDDKWVYVEGEFVSMGKSANGVTQFKLKGADGINVECNIPADGEKRAKALKAGQKVKVLGSFATYAGDKAPSLDQVMFKGL